MTQHTTPTPQPPTPPAASEAKTAPQAPQVKSRDDVPRDRKVRALKEVYYNDQRYRVGDVFSIRKPYRTEDDNGKVQTYDEFSKKAMEDVAADTPEQTTTGQQVLDEQQRQARASKVATGDKKVIE